MAVRDMGKRKIGHWGATKMSGNQRRRKQTKRVSGKPEEKFMKGCVTGQWERKVIAISQLEQDSHGEQAGHKVGE